MHDSNPVQSVGPARQQAVLESVRQWQSRLLQIDRRSPLLYYSIGKRGIALKDGSPDALLQHIATSRSGLAFLYAERVRQRKDLFDLAENGKDQEPEIRVRPGDLETDLAPMELQSRLSALSKRNREWQEEQGLNILFLALGFLHWVDEDEERACSPILLMPCDLLRASPRDPYLLVVDESEDVVVNPTLRHKLSMSAGVDLPENDDSTVVQYLERVSALVSDHSDWRVEPSVVLGAFPFSKLAMWEDLQLMVEAGVVHPLVRRLAGDMETPLEIAATAGSAVPTADAELKGGALDDLLAVRDQYAVVDADFSQLRAIELARGGANLVIHGPPGTGKSQTIANIVATLLAEGRKVLFVSEKTAALDVVKRRLTEVGLGSFCLDLHSDRAKKDSVYAQLEDALHQGPVQPRDFPYERLSARRQELNRRVRALHAIRQPLGLSVFSVYGRIAGLRDLPQLNVVVRNVAELDEERLRQIQDAARRVARRNVEFRAHRTSRWRALGPVATSPLLAADIRNDLALVRSATASLVQVVSKGAFDCGSQEPDTPQATEVLVRLLRHFQCRPPKIARQWLEPKGLEAALESASALRRAAEERQRLQRDLIEFLGEPRTDLPFGDWLAAESKDLSAAPRWEQLAGSTWSADLLNDPTASAGRWQQIRLALDALVDTSVELQTMLGVRETLDLRSAAESVVKIAERLIAVGVVPETWANMDAITSISTEVAAAYRHADEYASLERQLAQRFVPETIDRVDDEMLVRYKTDHRSFFRRLGSAFRTDDRKMRSCLKEPGKLSLEDATSAIDQALTIRRLRAAWTDREPNLKETLGLRYSGRETAWAKVELSLDTLSSLYREYPAQAERFYRILVSAESFARLGDVLRALKERMDRTDQLWPIGASRQTDHLIAVAMQATLFEEVAQRVSKVLADMEPLVRRPANLEELVQLLRSGANLVQIEEKAAASEPASIRDLGASYSRWSTDHDALEHALQWTEELNGIVGGPLGPSLIDRVAQPLVASTYVEDETATKGALERLLGAWQTVAERFPAEQTPWRSPITAPFAQVVAWCDDLSGHADEANDWVDYQTAYEALDRAVAANATDAMRALTDDSSLVPDLVLRRVYLSWLEHIGRAVPELQSAPADLEDVLRDFRELDARLPRSAQEHVRARCLASYPSRLSNANGMGELGVLGRELSKRKRRLPVRKLVARIPNLLQILKPVFMMSPLAVSQFLPRGESEMETLTFDAVIFDEASQVFPEDAVPALARAHQCIIVGDQKQLPPSSFFRKSEDEDDDSDDEGDATENRLAGVESILDVLVGMSGFGVTEVYLQVHYRSQHDALIRYSNHFFYEDRLLTFPSATKAYPGFGIRSIYLPDARFDAGGSRTNRVEAERVVQTVFELLESRPPSESIGVVAIFCSILPRLPSLGTPLLLSDRRYDDRFAVDAHERFFIKNLENVQGDERDHIILSIGYGPTSASGLVHNRFGPLNTDGGHRRLNVAVSRARRSVTVVHSLRPEDIRSETQGAQLLRRYLEFVRDPEVSIEGAVTTPADGEAESPFEEAVGRALERRGYKIARQVGCAKYAIDIGVVSEDGKAYDLGIECDGAAYHSSPSARDRDRLRQEILERLGWRGRIHRVWSTAWIRNPNAEVAAIERAIARARSMPRENPMPAQAQDGPKLPDTNQPQRPANTVPATRDLPSTSAFQLEPYVRADLRGYSPRAELQEEDPRHLARAVIEVVKREGPVHLDLVVERIRERYGLGRAGRIIREKVEMAVYLAVRSHHISVLPVLGQEGGESSFLVEKLAGPIEPHGPGNDGAVRKIDHVCDQEIDAVVIKVLHSMVGAQREEIVVSAARALGYNRTGSNVEQRIDAAVERLVQTGVLIDRVGSIVISE